MPILKANQSPPANYYADNLLGLFSSVVTHHKDLLTRTEQDLLNKIVVLPPPSIRLLARLLTRKGPWYRLDRLSYREVGNLQKALEPLATMGIIRHLSDAPGEVLLQLLRKEEVRQLFPHPGGCRLAAKLTKIRLVEMVINHYTDHQIRRYISQSVQWFSLTIAPLVMLCKLLYFGNRHHDWTTFILEDLGVTQFETYPLQPGGSLFANRQELDAYLLFSRLAGLSLTADQVPLVINYLNEPFVNRWLERARNKCLNTLARNQERLGNWHCALRLYRYANTTPAREREVRILHRLAMSACVQRKLQTIRDCPWDLQEQHFAERFPGKNPPAAAAITGFSLVETRIPNGIEDFALSQLKGPKGQGWHTENNLPLGLFGLAFWDIIFADVPGAFLHPFQQRPLDLYWPDFVSQRQPIIEQRLHTLETELAAVLTETFNKKLNVTNALVNWNKFDANLLDNLLTAIPANDLLTLIKLVLTDIRQSRSGFPDLLMIYKPGNYEFVEVKGPTDQLQSNQRVWLQRLSAAQLPVRVFKIHAY